MPKERKPKRKPKKDRLVGRAVKLAPEDSHPSQASGAFKDDPTFGEFRAILRQQREEDYEQANEQVKPLIRREEEHPACSSSIPTRSARQPSAYDSTWQRNHLTD